jgi:quinol-cytochrome oxidoreductase complex cytochrome b subunit
MRSRKAYLWLFAVLTLSGLLLMGLYVPVSAPPSAATPAPSSIPAGYVTRGIHFWAAFLAVLAILAHLARAIFVKTNRKRIGWAAALFLLTCLLWFTGMLLPWDQLGFWLSRLSARLGVPVLADPYAALYAVYWLHTLALSVPTIFLLIIYVRRTRGGRATPLTVTPASL